MFVPKIRSWLPEKEVYRRNYGARDFYLCGQAGQLEIDIQSAVKKAIKTGGHSDEETEAIFGTMVRFLRVEFSYFSFYKIKICFILSFFHF